MIEISFPHGSAKINIKKFCKDRPFQDIRYMYNLMIRDAFNYKEIVPEILREIGELIEECDRAGRKKSMIKHRCDCFIELIENGGAKW